MQLNKTNLGIIRKQIQAKLDELDLGISLTLGNCTFDVDNATFQLKALVEGGQTKEQKDLESVALYLNLDTNKEHDGYKLWGYKTRSPKRPFIVVKNNKQYIIDEDTAVKFYGKVKEVANG